MKATLGAEPADITALLGSWSRGDTASLEQLLPLVYDELRRIARRFLNNEPEGLTLQTTDVVHETFLRLIGHDRIDWRNRGQFFGIAGRTMRRLLVDHARRSLYAKRGAGSPHIPLERLGETSLDRPQELIELDDLLQRLAAIDPEKVKLVELRFFAGLSLEQTATALGRSRATVVRQWALTKAWLYRALRAVV
ncbi:MAG: sigma-70 family RNA polymerase sigma factor [Acidobacteriota bacterium]